MIIRLRLFLLFTLSFLAACSKDDDARRPYIPEVPVNEQLNLTNSQYTALRQDRTLADGAAADLEQAARRSP